MDNLGKHTIGSLGNRIRFDGWSHGDNVNDIYQKLKKPVEDQVNERSEKMKDALVLDMYNNPSNIYINKKLSGEVMGQFVEGDLSNLFKTLNDGDLTSGGTIFSPTKTGFDIITNTLLTKEVLKEKVKFENDDLAIDLSFKKLQDGTVLYTRKVLSVVTTEKCKFVISKDKKWYEGIIKNNSELSGSGTGTLEILGGLIKIEPFNAEAPYMYKITYDIWDQKNQSLKSVESYSESIKKSGEKWGTSLIDLKGSDFDDKSVSLYLISSINPSNKIPVYGVNKKIQCSYQIRWKIKVEDIFSSQILSTTFDNHLKEFYVRDLGFFASLNIAKWVNTIGMLEKSQLLQKLYSVRNFDDLDDKDEKKKFNMRMNRIKWIMKKHNDVISILKQADGILKNISLDKLRDFLVKVGQYNNDTYSNVKIDRKSKKYLIKQIPVLNDWGFKWDAGLEVLDTALLTLDFKKSENIIENLVIWCNSVYGKLFYRPLTQFTFLNDNISNSLKDVELNEKVKKLYNGLGSSMFEIDTIIKKDVIQDMALATSVDYLVELPKLISMFITDTCEVFKQLHPPWWPYQSTYFAAQTSDDVIENIKSLITSGMNHRVLEEIIFKNIFLDNFKRLVKLKWKYTDRRTGDVYLSENGGVVKKNDYDYGSTHTIHLKSVYDRILSLLGGAGTVANKLSDYYGRIYIDHLLPTLMNVNSLSDEVNVKLPQYILKYLRKAIEIDKDDFNTINSRIIQIAYPAIRLESVQSVNPVAIGEFYSRLKSDFFGKIVGNIIDEKILRVIAKTSKTEIRENVTNFMIFVDKYLTVHESSSLFSNVISKEQKSSLLAMYEVKLEEKTKEILSQNKIVDSYGFISEREIGELKTKLLKVQNRGKQVEVKQRKDNMAKRVLENFDRIKKLRNTNKHIVKREILKAVDEIDNLKNFDDVYLDEQEIEEINNYKNAMMEIYEENVRNGVYDELALQENEGNNNVNRVNYYNLGARNQTTTLDNEYPYQSQLVNTNISPYQGNFNQNFNTNYIPINPYNNSQNIHESFIDPNTNINRVNTINQNRNSQYDLLGGYQKSVIVNDTKRIEDEQRKRELVNKRFEKSELKNIPLDVLDMDISGKEKMDNRDAVENVYNIDERSNMLINTNVIRDEGKEDLDVENNHIKDVFVNPPIPESEAQQVLDSQSGNDLFARYANNTFINDFDKNFVSLRLGKLQAYDKASLDKKYKPYYSVWSIKRGFKTPSGYASKMYVPMNNKEVSALFEEPNAKTYSRSGTRITYQDRNRIYYTPYGKLVIDGNDRIKLPTDLFGYVTTRNFLLALVIRYVDPSVFNGVKFTVKTRTGSVKTYNFTVDSLTSITEEDDKNAVKNKSVIRDKINKSQINPIKKDILESVKDMPETKKDLHAISQIGMKDTKIRSRHYNEDDNSNNENEDVRMNNPLDGTNVEY
jgi:hypothetical protein